MDYYYVNKKRVIAHIDMDNFGVQVHLNDPKLSPQFKRKFKRKPCIAAQENKIISVNYKAKDIGINRDMSIEEAGDIASDEKKYLTIFKTPQKYDKPYRRVYTVAGDQIFDVIEDFIEKLGDIGHSIIIERVSDDDILLDITEICEQKEETYDRNFLLSLNAKVEGRKDWFSLEYNNQMKDKRLIYAAFLIKRLRDNITSKTGFKSSAGISYNKLLAKIACGLNKPNNLTLIAHKGAIDRIYENYPIEEMHGLKSGLGEDVINILNISKAIELRQFDREVLSNSFGTENGLKLWNIARGIDVSAVIYKDKNKVISSGRKFNKGINNSDQRDYYTFQECQSLAEKLNYDQNINNRIAKYIKVEYSFNNHSVRLGFDYNYEYYDSVEIFEMVRSHVFPKLDKRFRKKIFEMKLTARNFQENYSYIDSITQGMSRMNIQQQYPFHSFNNFYDSDY